MTNTQDDAITLARQFIVGRNVKRSELVDMVRILLELAARPIDMPPARMVADSKPVIPLVNARETKSPVAVVAGPAGSVFLGREANRYYSRTEAIALCSAISRTVTPDKR